MPEVSLYLSFFPDRAQSVHSRLLGRLLGWFVWRRLRFPNRLAELLWVDHQVGLRAGCAGAEPMVGVELVWAGAGSFLGCESVYAPESKSAPKFEQSLGRRRALQWASPMTAARMTVTFMATVAASGGCSANGRIQPWSVKYT